MDKASIRQAAAAGVDLAHPDRDLATRGKERDRALGRTDGAARTISFSGTPGFLMGSVVAPGTILMRDFDKMVEQAAQK